MAKKEDNYWLLIVAGLFMGLGGGMIISNIIYGIIIGLGLGIILMLFMKGRKK